MRKQSLRRYLKWYQKRVRFYLFNADTVLLEVWFGLQAIGTGALSLYFGNHLAPETKFFLWLNVLFAVPQILLAFSDNYFHRHWSNWLTFVFSICISVSLIGSQTDQIAVFGYAFLGGATLHAAFLVNARMHGKKKNYDKVDISGTHNELGND